MSETKSYYDFVDFDIEEVLLESGAVDQLMYLKDLKQRKMIVNNDINQMTIADVVRHILQFNREDIGLPTEARKPIILYIASNGGEADSGFELIDAIEASKTPVYTVNMGYQYSMGFLIGLAGHKRYAMKNAKFLHHDGTNVIVNSGAKVRDQVEFQDKVEARVKQYVIGKTHVTEAEYDTHLRQEWYLFADEAKEYGMVDYIIGIDCDIDEVV